MSESKHVDIKDYWAVIALEACGHIVESVTTIDSKDGKNKLLIYHFSDNAAEDYDAWARGEIRPIFDIVRQVQVSQRRFRENITRFNA